MSALHPPIRWAQRKDRVYLTVELRDIKNEKVEFLTPQQLKFTCTSDNNSFEEVIEFFDELNTEESKWNVNGLHMQFNLVKKR